MPRKSLIIVLCLAFASSTLAADSVDDALRAIDAGKYREGAHLLTPLADNGDVLAQYYLGLLHYNGQGVPEDEKEALQWWKKAAAQGSVEAMFQLGSAYLFGSQTAKLVPNPDREAATWYFQAASAGHAEAQYHLGLLFLAGKGVIDNRREALRWMRKAAQQGHAEAKKALAAMGVASN